MFEDLTSVFCRCTIDRNRTEFVCLLFMYYVRLTLMNSKSRSLLLVALVAGSTGLIAPARSQSVNSQSKPPTAEQLANAQQFCNLMRLPFGVSCMASPKTGQAVTFPTECIGVLSTNIPPGGTIAPSGGFYPRSGMVCAIDPRNDLPMLISPVDYPKLPPQDKSIVYTDAQQLVKAKNSCAATQLPDGLHCDVSQKTKAPVIVPTVCAYVLAMVSLPPEGGKEMLERGISLNNSLSCGLDPQTGLARLMPSPTVKALPPIKSRQEKGKAALAAGAPTATRSTMPGACSGINLPNGMMCLIDVKTGKSKVLPNPCLDWRVPSGLTCVVDPETASPISIVTPIK
jgi:hypothetical protein